MKVLIVTSECFPFAKVGGLADATWSLAKTLVSMGVDARVIMPHYENVMRGRFKLQSIDSCSTPNTCRDKFRRNDKDNEKFNLYENQTNGVRTYFVHNKEYFTRKEIYGENNKDYPDNYLRFSFLSKASLLALKTLDFRPDIIHCNDWHAALVPFYLKFCFNQDSFFSGVKTLFTIHNVAYQGIFDKGVIDKIGIPEDLVKPNGLEFYGKLNFMKSGILYADAISTVSRKYAKEITTPEYGFGLSGLLKTRNIHGITNGVDYSVWNPETDRFIKTNFSADNIEKKAECKKDLLEYTGLDISQSSPIIGCVTRLVKQKGMDMVAGIMDKIVSLGVGMVILGQGSEEETGIFLNLAERYPKNVYVSINFDEEFAHKIEAGSDMFIMPSRYEPCGLNQMYSLKYGTIPIVRSTGGLDDTITDFDDDKENGNGFKFIPAQEDALYFAVKRAVNRYSMDKALWKKLMVRAMKYDFSWEKPAGQYLDLYRALLYNKTSDSSATAVASE